MASATCDAYCFSHSRRFDGSIITDFSERMVPIVPIAQGDLHAYLSSHGPVVEAWANTTQFGARKGEVLVVPDDKGSIAKVLLGQDSSADLWSYAALPSKLPPGRHYCLELPAADIKGRQAALLGWSLGSYSFKRYKQQLASEAVEQPPAQLACPLQHAAGSAAELAAARADTLDLAQAFYWCRDLINTPANDLGPMQLAAEARALAQQHGAHVEVIEGEELLARNFPAIYTVGRASSRQPLLIDINWSPPGAADTASLPLLALVGKGVVFDTGGLDIKSAAGMRLMKKDMGGAALVLALAHLVMSRRLPVRLRLLVPAVENSISGSAFRPLDVLRTRSGLTVENGNTDAEGRLILCDALYEACTAAPDLLVDAATLTGAARAALGPELPAVFCNSDEAWAQLSAAAAAEADPLWRLPLHAPYRKLLDSKVADLGSTAGEGAQGGAVVAALFLQEFVKGAGSWIHMDTGAWTQGAFSSPGRPEGGEGLGLRALMSFIASRYCGTAQQA